MSLDVDHYAEPEGRGMNDSMIVALGRGVIKVLISAFIGTGVGLVTFGVSTRNRPDIWIQHNPPGEMFLAVGVGMLTTGVAMAGAFILPRLAARQLSDTAKPMVADAWQA